MRVKQFVTLILAATLANQAAWSATVTIPAGTKVFGELDQQVTSNTREFEVGDIVQGRAWRNVVVNGQTVVAAGAPMMLRISDIKKRRIAGRGGDVTIRAVSVRSVDGDEIFLDGGYDKEAGNRTGLAASLSALVFWPAIFIRGKEAVLEPGTIFDASIPANTTVNVPDGQRPTLRLTSTSDLSVEVLYDEIEEKAKQLPLRVTLCDEDWPESIAVTAVNDAAIDAIPVEVSSLTEENSCGVATAGVLLDDLTKHFVRGINRFSVAGAGETTEVVLDVEM